MGLAPESRGNGPAAAVSWKNPLPQTVGSYANPGPDDDSPMSALASWSETQRRRRSLGRVQPLRSSAAVLGFPAPPAQIATEHLSVYPQGTYDARMVGSCQWTPATKRQHPAAGRRHPPKDAAVMRFKATNGRTPSSQQIIQNWSPPSPAWKDRIRDRQRFCRGRNEPPSLCQCVGAPFTQYERGEIGNRQAHAVAAQATCQNLRLLAM